MARSFECCAASIILAGAIPSNAAPLLLFWPMQFPRIPCHISFFGQCDSLKCRAASLVLAGAIPSNAVPLLLFWLAQFHQMPRRFFPGRRDPSNAMLPLLFWPARFPQMPCCFSCFGRHNSLECHTASIILAGTIPSNVALILLFRLARSFECRAASLFLAYAIPSNAALLHLFQLACAKHRRNSCVIDVY